VKTDKLKIDSHKLIYHIPRVHDWLKGKNIYPIYVEATLFGGCNHRCIFCALDYLKYKPNILSMDSIRHFIIEARRKGVKSIYYAGEGEPFLHKDAPEIIAFTKKSGIDVAVTTNGVMFDSEVARKSLGYLSWLRVSLNAGTKKSYSFIHNTRKDDFDIVIDNLKKSVKLKKKNKYNCTIGVQFLLLPQNYKEAAPLAGILSGIGVDYLIIKPYSQHPLSINRIGAKLKYTKEFDLDKKLAGYSKNNFQVIFRRHSMDKLEERKPYKYCLGLPFLTHITANGDVYPCSRFLGNKNFVFGNICRDSFGDIWEGKRRVKIMGMIYSKWDINRCRQICRLDEINRYLWELKNPGEHVNFV